MWCGCARSSVIGKPLLLAGTRPLACLAPSRLSCRLEVGAQSCAPRTLWPTTANGRPSVRHASAAPKVPAAEPISHLFVVPAVHPVNTLRAVIEADEQRLRLQRPTSSFS